MSETTRPLFLYYVEMCTYIIPNISNTVQIREIQLTQSNGAFHFITCRCTVTSGKESQTVRKEVWERDEM